MAIGPIPEILFHIGFAFPEPFFFFSILKSETSPPQKKCLRSSTEIKALDSFFLNQVLWAFSAFTKHQLINIFMLYFEISFSS